MKFVRPLALSVVCAGALGLLAGCSGKPENSPAIRKKFAEIDSMNGNVEQLLADVKSLNDEVRRLKQENSELRAFLPGVDGQGAIDKISTLENRLRQIENARTAAPAPATGSAPRTAPATPASTAGGQIALEDAPLAAAPAPRVVANQQAAPAPAAPRGFKELTNRPAAAAPAPRPAAPAAAPTGGAPAAAAPAAAATKPAAPKPAASRGSYHVIAPGDTIATIAAKHGISAERLQQAVGLPPGARLTPGQRIFVPGN
jgi:outer membrane murein-binding lipoprotein Lpp